MDQYGAIRLYPLPHFIVDFDGEIDIFFAARQSCVVLWSGIRDRGVVMEKTYHPDGRREIVTDACEQWEVIYADTAVQFMN